MLIPRILAKNRLAPRTMADYLKHKSGKRKEKITAKKTQQPEPPPGPPIVMVTGPDSFLDAAGSIQHEINYVAGLSEIATQLEAIHGSLRSYNVNACDGEMTFHHVLEGEALESIADSLKRIADALSAQRA
jgi:hypothetical protein